MDTVTVEFIGMCTHVLSAVDEWYHRVVLPLPRETTIAPHKARLLVPKAAADEAAIESFTDGVSLVRDRDYEDDEYWAVRLKGVELSMADTAGAYTLDEIFQEKVYPLRKFTSGHLGRPSEKVWKARKRTRAHAYFNVKHGKFSARLHGKATVAVLEMKTTGDRAVLRATPFGTSNVRSLELAKTRVPIRVSHTNADCDRDDEHFLLHFELAHKVPPDPDYPKSGDVTGEAASPGDGLGAGCSNSTFP